ncbi:13720_t:CDS:2 [Funneliformis geosporum]|uniref:Altered inheritance of mitochondria protein 41 n=1 Tax=Funneliformis geosporum TaxID=1117311 RepID=A0A9W4WS81_9GLOM|nr:13720_t:CDS:2 [Funneliformis geosporum]CAI2168248.1 19897_t:CDS:2 [Funneliformis geosporum]
MERFNRIRYLTYHRLPINSTYSFTTTSGEVQPSLLTKLRIEVKDAMRKKDQLKLNVVRGILSDVTYASKSSSQTMGIIPTDQEIYVMINRAIKRRQESITQFSQAGRKDLVENEQDELKILVSYLPEQMSEREIEIEVKRVVKKLGITGEGGSKDLGKIMKEIKIDNSKASKKLVSDVVKKLLSDMSKNE